MCVCVCVCVCVYIYIYIYMEKILKNKVVQSEEFNMKDVMKFRKITAECLMKYKTK